MKIELDLPDWVFDKTSTLRILKGLELVAFREPKKEWKVKKVRCVQCGECCLDMPDGHTPFGSDEEGKCNALKKEGDKWICTAGDKKPFVCLGDPLKGNTPSCSIEYF